MAITLLAAQAAAGDLVTEGKYYACLSEQWLDEFTSSAVRQDYASITDFLADDKCLVLRPNLPVMVMEEPTLHGTRVTFSIQGIRFYAPSEEIVSR